MLEPRRCVPALKVMTATISHIGGIIARATEVSTASSLASSAVVQFPARQSSPDYAGILAAIASGDRNAETKLVQALTAPLNVVLRNRARNAEGVDDLCQDALIAVLQAARDGRIEDPVALVAYALETARNLALNAERKRSRRQTYSAEDVINDTADAAEGSEELTAGDQLRSCVRTVLDSLPSERDRQLLHSYYLKETPSSELQTQWAMDSAQFGKVLHRARERFGRLWQTLKFDAPLA